MPASNNRFVGSALNQIGNIFVITKWLPGYTRTDFFGDLLAGVTVGVMLIPQSMAYAMLAGLPPIYGLYASVVPLLVYPIFGSSRHLAVGIVAVDMLIVAAGLSTIAEPGSTRYIELAILLALMAGLLQIMMGAARLGFLVNLLSRPVITGFSSAAALVIAFSQLGNLLGISLSQTQYIHILIWEAVTQFENIRVIVLTLGLGAIFLLILLRRWKPLFPAPLAAVVLGIAVVWWFALYERGVAIVGDIPTGLPRPSFPEIDLVSVRTLIPTAITLALVQFMTVISLGKVFAARNRYSIRANRELLAIGAANFFGSIFRGLPVSGSFSRTAVNAQAGARTPLANIFAAGVVILTLLFLTPLFYYLPVPVLAAIIMVAASGLLDLKEMRALLRTKRIDGVLTIVTFFTTLIIGIQQGVLIGIMASVVAIMYRISRPYVAILGHLPGTRSFRDLRRYPDAHPMEGILMLRVDASFSFANAEFVKDLILERSEKGDDFRAVIIDASSINDLDTTAVAVLFAVAEILRERGVELYFGGVKDQVQDVMVRSGLYEKLGADHFFLSPHRAVKSVLSRWGKSEEYLENVPGESETADPSP